MTSGDGGGPASVRLDDAIYVTGATVESGRMVRKPGERISIVTDGLGIRGASGSNPRFVRFSWAEVERLNVRGEEKRRLRSGQFEIGFHLHCLSYLAIVLTGRPDMTFQFIDVLPSELAERIGAFLTRPTGAPTE